MGSFSLAGCTNLVVVAVGVVGVPQEGRRSDAFIVRTLVDLLLLKRGNKKDAGAEAEAETRAGAGAGAGAGAEPGAGAEAGNGRGSSTKNISIAYRSVTNIKFTVRKCETHTRSQT